MTRLEIYASVFLMMASWFLAVTSSEKKIEKYHVQVRVYVDSEAFSDWKKLSRKNRFEDYVTEIKSYFVEIQRTYDSLEEFNSIAITFEIESIEMLKDDILRDPYYINAVKGRPALEMFRNYIYWDWKKKPYDMAILLTGHYLGAKRLAFANLGQVCTVDAVGIIEQRTTDKMVLVLAHEMGHILGANHDDDEYEDQSCYKDNGKVMNPAVHAFSKNQYYFSYCSYSHFEGNLASLNRKPGVTNCLKDGNKTVSGIRLGALIAPDDYCKRYKFGGDFISRTESQRTSYSRICDSLTCYETSGKTSRRMKTLQGIPCGKNKVCNRDVCEESSDGSPFVSDSCPIGDQPRLPPNYDISCDDIDPSDCPMYMVECCHTCNKTNPIFSMTADDVCQKLAGEKFVMLRLSTSHGDHLCSQLTCAASSDGRNFNRKMFQAPNGMVCGTNKRCSWGKCVRTKHGNPNIPDDCPFGDQDLKALGYKGTCQKYSQDDRCGRWKTTCCKSCE